MCAFQANLFKDGSIDGFFQGAPRLEPNTDGASTTAKNSSPSNVYYSAVGQTQEKATKVVDVHGQYPWTVTDDARAYIPKLRLIEHRLTQASEINGAAQTLIGAAENVNVASELALGQMIDPTGQVSKFNNALFGDFTVKGAAQKVASGLGMLAGGSPGRDILGALGTTPAYMKPYVGLYTVKPTFWEYVLPYLGASNMMNNTNTFSDYNFNARFITPIANLFTSTQKSTDPSSEKSKVKMKMGALPEATNVLIAGAPGAIKAESPQSFTGATKEALQVTFYLLNTISPEHIRMNWEFCYLFSYQNLPNRRSINLLDAPRIYTAQILGYKTIPACYITDLKIENVGAVRMINIGSTAVKQNAANTIKYDVSGDSETMKMIPEAYKVSFTLQSVFINSQNLFRLTLEPGGGIITTAVSNSQFGPNFNQTAAGRNNLSVTEAANLFNPSSRSMGGSSPGYVPIGGYTPKP